MTHETLPTSGGAYIRNPDGSLTLVEAPTADGYRLAVRAAAETPVEAPVEAPVEGGAAPAFRSRRTPAPAPVKEA
jgi:hypothetical protein